jgi:anti-sigma B factor antagonist
MQINSTKENELMLLELNGELDASCSVQMDNELSKAINENTKGIAINCEGLQYISSAGLGVFISYINEMEQKNQKLVFYNMSEKIYHVFEMVGIGQMVKIVSDKSAAVSFINA